MLKAPFPYFGGKSRVSSLVWKRLGDVPNYIEPFAGSMAVLLGRPHKGNYETVNDINGYITNTWRAIQNDPIEVAKWADNPVHELDLHARHWWLRKEGRAIVEHLRNDPDFYDAKVAGWWVWGIACSIGSDWCTIENDGKAPTKGLFCGSLKGTTSLSNRDRLYELFERLSVRFKYVQIASGEWSRITGYSFADKRGLTGVFLDPPYGDYAGVYGVDECSGAVREWALANGDNPMLRIALCGYEGEHSMPDTWECVEWKANGGMGNKGKTENLNRHRERIWFSPHCLRDDGLFTEEEV